MRWSTRLTRNIRSRRGSLTWAPLLAHKKVVEGEASLQAPAVVAELIEKMAEVGSWSSMTSDHEIEIVQRSET